MLDNKNSSRKKRVPLFTRVCQILELIFALILETLGHL